MQPIIILGAAVVAVALVGSGFLGDPWNNIELWVQELGWGEQDLQAPISHAYIDLELKKEVNPGADGETGTDDDYFDNLIKACSFHSDQSLDAFDPQLGLAPALIICKLTNDQDQAIAEGKIILDGVGDESCEQRDAPQNGYQGSSHIRIDICQTAYPGANGVMEVHDIKIVVEDALNRMGQ
jgi:hypothetical protein